MYFMYMTHVTPQTRRKPPPHQDLRNELSGRASNTIYRSRFLVRGCDEALFSAKERFFQSKGVGIQGMRGLVRTSTGKAVQ